MLSMGRRDSTRAEWHINRLLEESPKLEGYNKQHVESTTSRFVGRLQEFVLTCKSYAHYPRLALIGQSLVISARLPLAAH